MYLGVTAHRKIDNFILLLETSSESDRGKKKSKMSGIVYTDNLDGIERNSV